MKVEVENGLVYHNAPYYERTLRMFGLLIDIVLRSKNKSELLEALEYYERAESLSLYFDYGFGSSHFWAHQKDEDKRIIYADC